MTIDLILEVLNPSIKFLFMHSNSFLTSNLLDIIFENRNKDYGAYVLRKNYNKRLLKSLIMALAFISMFIFCLMLVRKSGPTKLSVISFVPDPFIIPIKPVEKKTESQKHLKSQVRSPKAADATPVIVDNVDNIPEQPPPTDVGIITSNTGDNLMPPSESPGTDNTGDEIKEPVKPALAAPDKTIPVSSPEVLPQFPGGLKELIKFLKRNLNTPQEMQEGEQIAVKVKFIVGYNGDLMGFDVVETGGEPFDNEVIKALKKMPKWIPGKANGENVSTYFILPVKFTVSD